MSHPYADPEVHASWVEGITTGAIPEAAEPITLTDDHAQVLQEMYDYEAEGDDDDHREWRA